MIFGPQPMSRHPTKEEIMKLRPICLITTSIQLVLLVMGVGATGQVTYQRLKSFGFPELSGADPRARVIEARDGGLYGTTSAGGNTGNGTVFKLNNDGTGYAVLHSFTGIDGDSPWADLVEGTDGVLYGTTFGGGSAGAGTVFKLNKDGGGFVVLHNFDFGRGDGHLPVAGLVEGNDGGLYGTTEAGGTSGGGTVFKLNKDGSGF